jgi:hypothetical protein
MKKPFQSYYRLSKKELEALWKDGLIVPDTNVLLNLYRYSEATRSELLKFFAALGTRLWLPYQVGREFHKRRLSVIFEQHEKYEGLQIDLDDIFKRLETTRGHPFVSPRLWQRLQRIQRDVRKELQRNADGLLTLLDDDPTLDEITRLFEGRVGEPFSHGEIEELKGKGATRYKERVPPGFEDEKKPEEGRYGDLIIWMQILREAESKKRGAILISDDAKEDWWLRIRGKTIGPLPALREEFAARTDKHFHMYSSALFIEHAGVYLKRQVEKETLKEVRETSAAQRGPERAGLLAGLPDYRREVGLLQALLPTRNLETQLRDAMRLQGQNLEQLGMLERIRAGLSTPNLEGQMRDAIRQAQLRDATLETQLRDAMRLQGQNQDPLAALERIRAGLSTPNLEAQIRDAILHAQFRDATLETQLRDAMRLQRLAEQPLQSLRPSAEGGKQLSGGKEEAPKEPPTGEGSSGG